MKVAIVFGLILCSSRLYAQGVPEIPSQVPFNLSSNSVKTFDGRYSEIKGIHTFFETYQFGRIQFSDNQEKPVLLNYDALNDQILIKKDSNAAPFALRKDVVDKFVVKSSDGQVYEFVKLKHDDVEGYFLRLVNGKISLYCKVSKIIHRKKSDGDHYSEGNPDEFIKRNFYFVKKGDGSLQELQKSKKGILKTFTEQEAAVSNILKKHKVDFDDYSKITIVFSEIEKLF